MNKFFEPAMSIDVFNIEDIIATSTGAGADFGGGGSGEE